MVQVASVLKITVPHLKRLMKEKPESIPPWVDRGAGFVKIWLSKDVEHFLESHKTSF